MAHKPRSHPLATTAANASLGCYEEHFPHCLYSLKRSGGQKKGVEDPSDMRLPSRASFHFDAPPNEPQLPLYTSFKPYRPY
jgi:hypothetical protein